MQFGGFELAYHKPQVLEPCKAVPFVLLYGTKPFSRLAQIPENISKLQFFFIQGGEGVQCLQVNSGFQEGLVFMLPVYIDEKRCYFLNIFYRYLKAVDKGF